MKNIIYFAIILGTLSACSHHKIELRANHFLTPIVAEKTLSGHAHLAITSVSTITLVEDKTSNPPLRDRVRINEDDELSEAIASLMPIRNISVDAGLTVLEGLELGLNGNVLALKYQFLNRQQTNTWISAISLGAGLQDQSSSSSSSSGGGTTTTEVQSNIKILRTGASIGYRYDNWTPYASYVYENFDVSTDIENSHGKFNDLKDSGNHNSFSIGITTSKPGFSMAAEYSLIRLEWNRATDVEWQSALGGRLGFAW